MHQLIHDLGVEELERALTPIDERDLGCAERGEHRCVFDANDPGPDHRQRPRDARERPDVVAGEDRLAVDRHARGCGRARADRDHDACGGHGPRRPGRFDSHGVGIHERRPAADDFDPIATELLLEDIHLSAYDLIDPGQQLSGGRTG